MVQGKNLVSAIMLLLFLPGCSSVAKGVTEAILERSEKEDTRSCEVRGEKFSGVQAFLNNQGETPFTVADASRRTVKILMVHGIGRHIPGYSTRLSENLTGSLGLNVTAETVKEITLRPPKFLKEETGETSLGKLRIQRFFNKERTRELLFYELTWSDIIKDEKALIEYDDSGTYAFKRASINRALKKFFNSHVPDPMIYLGSSRERILLAVRQASCWMFRNDWTELPEKATTACEVDANTMVRRIADDDYFFVTHSLGSRVMIDALQSIAADFGGGKGKKLYPGLFSAVQKKNLTVFMLANQLPLLQLGRPNPEVTRQFDRYCRLSGDKYDERMFSQVRVVAFSDPNDVLSYAIPPKFAEDHLDSRLCPKIVNVSINVANVVELFGFGDFADPAEAHGGYDHDERVIELIANGIGNSGTSQIVRERCKWLEIVRE